jgi:hypothetical protein
MSEMLTLHGNRREQTIQFRVDGAEPLACSRYTNGKSPAHYFMPVSIVLTYTDGDLTQVAIRGPQVTKKGGIHTTKWSSWLWPMARGEERYDAVDQVPGVPGFLSDALTMAEEFVR